MAVKQRRKKEVGECGKIEMHEDGNYEGAAAHHMPTTEFVGGSRSCPRISLLVVDLL